MGSIHGGWTSALLLAQGLTWGAAALAQTAPAEGTPPAQPPEEDPAATETADDGKTRAGPFVLEADITVSQGYIDNVYATRNDKIGDGIVVVTPEVTLSTENQPIDLEFFGSAEIGRYWDETSEDYEDFDFGLDATYRFDPQSVVFGGASFGRDHEERQSPDDVRGSEPTLYYDSQAYLGTAQRFDRVTLRAGGTFERLDYEDVDAVGGSINNDDRDRNLYTAGVRAGFLVSPGYEIFAQGLYDLRDYDNGHDDFGFERDSDGYSAALGLRYRPSRSFDVEASVGYLGQYYDDPTFDATTAPDFGLRLEWRPQTGTRINGFVDRSVQETTLFGASGYLSTGYGLSLTQQVRRDISVEASLAYYEDEYQGLHRDDNIVDFGLGGRYYITPNIFLGTNYSFLQRDSTDPDDDYDEHQVYFSLGAELSPAFDANEPDPGPPVGAGLGGLYGGVQASLTQLATSLEGPRGTGTLTAEFADHGFGGGPFLGYALRAGDWQFGLEIDGELSGAKWHHSQNPSGRVFSVEKESSVSAGPVVGYWLNEDSMIYSRFAVVESEFNTDYFDGTNRTEQSNSLTGLRFGLGGETTLSGNFFLRLDYSYTTYQDLDIAHDTGNDNFANNESLARLGVGYRFPGGATDTAEEAGDEADVNPAGFYVGAGGGHDTLTSENHGDRQAGSVLDAEAGEGGAAGGLFAGYGLTWHDIYLGAEGEAELSNTSWERSREPTGRNFTIDREGGIGAGLRLGYVLPGGALAYARAGVMYSKFHTEVRTTGNTFEEDEWLLGGRLGVGLDLPLSESFFARLEYSYTAYEDASLATGSGPEDFEHSEGLFRAGLGFRF